MYLYQLSHLMHKIIPTETFELYVFKPPSNYMCLNEIYDCYIQNLWYPRLE